MKRPKKLLCICKGNSDRSPLMAAILQMYLKNAGITDVTVESAGILDVAANGGCASPYMIKVAETIGIDLSDHCKRQATPELLADDYDLFVVVDDFVAEEVLNRIGFDKIKQIYNADIHNPWPSQHLETYQVTAKRILAAMFDVMRLYFAPVTD